MWELVSIAMIVTAQAVCRLVVAKGLNAFCG